MQSDGQQQPETGTNSIDSSESLSPAEEAMKEQLLLQEGLNRLQRMSAIDSIDRNLTMEDAAVKEDLSIHQSELWGDGSTMPSSQKKTNDDEMRILAARDVIIKHGSDNDTQETPAPEKKEEPKVTPPTPPPVETKQEMPKVITLPGSDTAKNLIAAGITAAGVGLGASALVATYNMTKSPSIPPAIVEGVDTDTKYGFDIISSDQVRRAPTQ